MNTAQAARIKTGIRFVATLDQSGSNTSGALKPLASIRCRTRPGAAAS
jgi:hypothetical protein